MRWAILVCGALLAHWSATVTDAQTPGHPIGPQACRWDDGVIPDAPLPPRRIIMSADAAAETLKYKVPPVYPTDGGKRLVGTISLCAIIGKAGTILRLQYTSGPERLANAAMDAVRQWRYQPALLNGKPVEVETRIYVDFRPGDQIQKRDQAPN